MSDKKKKEIFVPYVEVEGNLATHGDKIIFRDEQGKAIKDAYDHLSKSGQARKFLWNAKMRFGKTICAMELVRRLDVKTTLIVTHRPVVDKGWHEDFEKVFKPARLKSLKEDLLESDKTYKYGSRSLEEEDGLGFSALTAFAKKEGCYGVYFVSMQYLALAEIAGGKNKEKQKRDILEFPWDMVIVDEAHEGTQTDRGQNVLSLLAKPATKMLYLSGTPFNLYDDFDDKELYTWDYVMEQMAKENWDSSRGPNPYLTLPRMNIFTYDLGQLVVGKGAAFTFAEFFRTKSGVNLSASEQGKFVHEEWVTKFLDKLCEDSTTSNYPFSTDEYRLAFNHTLWVVPGVKEAKALEMLLKRHDIFKHFSIVNVAGDKDADEARENALDELRTKITNRGRKTRSITLSCGRLTTGVTVPEWSAIFYLKGSENTSASTYMQTIFRAQTPYVFEEKGIKKYKANCYVFDFAPDRSLRMLAETAKFSTLKQKQKLNAKNVGSHDEDIQKMKDFLKFCPVISLDGTMKEFDAERLFTQLNQVYIDRVVRNGFNDNSLYDVQALLDLDVDNLNALGETIAKSSNLDKPPKAKSLPKDIQMAKGGLTGKGETSTGDDDQKEDENDEEKRRKKARRDERDRRIRIIRGLALRVPLMMFGAEVTSDSEEITRENFTKKIDDKSWEEFMPRGVTKADFNSIKTAFNQTIFTGAGKKIRQLARQADDMTVTERIQRIAEIFDSFHNPDKETVLTRWRVVNMHMSDTIGGYCFFNESFTGPNQVPRYMTGDKLIEYVDTNEPRFVERKRVTDKVFFDREVDAKGNPKLKSKILEINSKTGLYPLYVAYTLFRARKADFENLGLIEDTSKYSVEEEQAIWDDILLDNIYIICNTEMAARITKRTLVGFRDVSDDRVNIKPIKLAEEASTNRDKLIKDLKRPGFWHKGVEGEEMKFNAVVGNPPYQEAGGSGGTSDSPMYQLFGELSFELKPQFISLITPARWFTAGREGLIGPYREHMLTCGFVRRMDVYPDSHDVFPSVEIKGGIEYHLINLNEKGSCKYILHDRVGVQVAFRDLSDFNILIRYPILNEIVKKVLAHSKSGTFVDSLISNDTPFGIGTNPKDSKKNPIKVYPSLGTGHEVALYHIEDSKRKVEYIAKRSVSKNVDDVDKFKVFVPTGYGAGEGFPHQILGQPEIAPKNSACTQSYLYAAFAKQTFAKNFVLYLKTKFFRALVLAVKSTQSAPSKVYRFVPVLDFSETWTDEKLYEKYKLTGEEIKFINKMIKPME